MQKRHEMDRSRAAERHAKAAVGPSTLSISKRPGEGERGDGKEGGTSCQRD